LLQPIAVFVHCNRQVPPTGRRRESERALNSAQDDANTFDRQLNSVHFSQIILFHFMMEPRVK